MRDSLLAGCTAALFALPLLLANPAAAQKLDLTKPEDQVAASRKLACSLTDKKPAAWWWTGHVYSRVPGEKDRLLFNVQGWNVRQCVTLQDPKRGTGYRLVSRELLFYQDPKTNEIVRTWTNPWTNEQVEVLHVANDPVNMRPTFPIDEQGNPATNFKADFKDGKGFFASEVPLFYPNPLQGAYQPYVGGMYQAIELFNFFFDEAQLLDRKAELDSGLVSWGRVSSFLPWMKMGDRPGSLIFNTVGKRVAGIAALPPAIQAEINANYALYKEPPPVDDARPNETSWTVFKKKMEEKK